jgi:hypothetical protein
MGVFFFDGGDFIMGSIFEKDFNIGKKAFSWSRGW